MGHLPSNVPYRDTHAQLPQSPWDELRHATMGHTFVPDEVPALAVGPMAAGWVKGDGAGGAHRAGGWRQE